MITENKKNVLVIGASQSHGMTIIRSMGRKGFNVYAIGERLLSYGYFSRYTRGRLYLKYKSENISEKEIIEKILYAIKKYRVNYIFAIEEKIITILIKYQKLIPCTCTSLILNGETFFSVLEKYKYTDTFKRFGFLYPESQVLNLEKRNWKNKLKFPLLVKQSSKSKINFLNDFAKNKLEKREKIKNNEELDFVLDNINTDGKLIIQEYVEGVEGSVMFVASDGEIIVAIQSEYTAEILKGLSVARKSVPLEKDLYSSLDFFCKYYNWTGVGGIDYIKSNEKYYILECNGRFTASTNLSYRLGVDLAWLHFNSFVGECNRNLIINYECDQHDATFGGLTWWVLYVLFGKVVYRAGKVKAILYYLSFFVFKKRNFDMLVVSDPLPAFIEFMTVIFKPLTISFKKIFKNYV